MTLWLEVEWMILQVFCEPHSLCIWLVPLAQGPPLLVASVVASGLMHQLSLTWDS